MTRFLNLDGDAVSFRQTELIVELEQGDVKTWALDVTLLLQGLVESLIVRSSDEREVVLSLQSEGEGFAKRTIASRIGPSKMQFEMSRTQAKFFQAVLLRAYRDGEAEVDHIHIEGELGETPYDLTVAFRTSRPPMSAEEAARLLDKA